MVAAVTLRVVVDMRVQAGTGDMDAVLFLVIPDSDFQIDGYARVPFMGQSGHRLFPLPVTRCCESQCPYER